MASTERTTRPIPLSVRVSEQEYETIKEMAQQAGLGLSSYLRNCVMVATGRDPRFHAGRQ